MKKDKLVLADGTEIELETSQGLSAMIVIVESKSAACALWEVFTPENLEDVTIKNADGLTVGKYPDMVLDHIIGADKDGSVQITFSLRNKSTEEVLAERVNALEVGQQTQDEAIGDLGQAVSDIVEGSDQ
ncbi:MAG: hypothetical protein NC341_08610 [Blautia sp.]|nr:hypothetical protein [Blautia sp.]MCM1201497.1 hypothetical protein [Bacteroides fragilis]